MKYFKWLAVPLVTFGLVFGTVAPANAYTITDRHVLVMPGYTQYKCIHHYNFFERIFLGKTTGWVFGAHNCR